ncbi:phosphoglycerate kinase [Candidatus Peregrinibacteria bacterium]|jgi:phosphoglycerate kinase|nr:phosphoglycerate kinase [Candidatus Peregrinibacteria bacterium]MBT4631903.1 phosphoglycerate kinase [Candidatus Peregrinibacteria bacterium]MBT5516551.1 phosphoglycerate kinase [Candidatus Peregrinibacteria bacterium]MBT5824176.1 phosphoglycerate kinase [Candidatus Peregrinibacteria bacterium]
MLKTISSLDFEGQKVLLRLDLNAPISNGQIQDDTRLQAALPTIKFLSENGAKVLILTHLGRPKGEIVESLRVDIIASALSKLLSKDVNKLDDCVDEVVKKQIDEMDFGDIVLLENTRFHPEEKLNDPEFSKELASLADIFVNDAFGVVHRSHASTLGVTEHLPSYAGFLLEKEIEVLSDILKAPQTPVCLIMGGAKIDTKIGVLEKFLDKADSFLIGGALANTFIAAKGFEVGTSLFQEDKVDVAKDFMSKCEATFIPVDFVVSEEISKDAVARNLLQNEATSNDKILDIGPKTIDVFLEKIASAKTIIWNGPMGLYEFDQFAKGTLAIAQAVADSDAISVVGGGDSIDAIKNFNIPLDAFTHVSTGGGAMLEFLEGKPLPALQALMS